ncbi:GyrI-like domain-containing protein [Pyxidicoccus caerfyrddinensis]|uniref:GyrI-like domain-containing protein n=1 Tax=Pyxidicoccus caerfyrddinensis TaxID=2709663 RepID=UPI0019673C81|nr:GyrI-like domain-containing protein [Pyxidicoccus caerfyrddinensis]
MRTANGATEKMNLRALHKEIYAPSHKEFSVVVVPRMSFVMADGEGNPNLAQSYRDAVQALYAVSYTLKFASKKLANRDYVVAPLEGLWSADDPAAFVQRRKDEWKWTMMIMQPEWITKEMFDEAVEVVRTKKNPAALPGVYFDTYDEGLSVQIMHIGSYDDEAPTLRRLHEEYMPANGLDFNGPHHEVYIGDPRKAEPSKLKTILRQPVKRRT